MRISILNWHQAPAYFAALVLLSVLSQATPASALVNCEGYTSEQLRTMAPAERVQWLTEELAQCDQSDEDRAIDYFGRGNAYSDLNELELAIADYDQAIAFNPAFVDAYYNRGNAYGDLGEFEFAIADYDQALALNPNYGIVYYNRGRSYYLLNQLERAIWNFDRAIEFDPNDGDAYANRALITCLLSVPRTSSALNDVLTLVQMEPRWAIDWQAYLSEEGYYTGPISGNFDEASQAAFSAWCDA